MAQRIKGIKIEIDGDTSKLNESLGKVNTQIYSTTSELKRVDSLLKNVSPGNLDLLKQKQELLSGAIKDTTDKLNLLKQAKAEADSNDNVDKNSEGYRELTRQIISTEQSLSKLNGQLSNTNTAIEDNSKGVKNFGDKTEDASKKTSIFGDVLKANLVSEVVKTGLTNLVSGIKKVADGLVDLTKSAINSYAEYEQLVGGVETLFGEDSAKKIEEYASTAYKTAGISANEYMEQATSFSAALISSLGGDTEKAVDVADMAIKDMSDNANKFGTDISSIQNAYQGFAKQNYTMLDNLKLGYAGTKSGMQELLKDAEKLSGQKYDISNLNDVYEAIHVVQQEMGVTGTTAEEAAQTISGSTASMKASWQNLLTGIADDDANFTELIDNFSESLLTMLDNVLPRVEIAINGIIDLIPSLITNLLPSLVDMGSNLITNLVNGINSKIGTVTHAIVNMIKTLSKAIIDNLPTILNLGITLIVELVKGIGESLPSLIPAITDAIILMVDTLIDNIDMLIDAALVLILGLADGLIIAIPRLLEKVPEIITKLVTKLTEPEMLAKLISAALQLILALAGGLIEAIPQLVKMVPQIITDINSSLVKTIKETDWKALGKNILDGILEGLTKFGDSVKKAAKKVFTAIKDNIKEFFGIKSPSKVMRDEIGKFIPQGVAVGIEKEIPNTIKEVQNAMSELNTGIQASVNPTINPTANSNPLIIQIENFNNSREQDVESLAEELEFYRKNSALAKGGN